MPGFASHWNQNSNLAWRFDTWFLNLFPRANNRPFVANPGGYATLSFIPTLGTMVLGLLAGGVLLSGAGRGVKCFGWLRRGPSAWPPDWRRIITASAQSSNASGRELGVYSGGICLFLLAAFYVVIEIWQLRRWAFPWIVIGMN